MRVPREMPQSFSGPPGIGQGAQMGGFDSPLPNTQGRYNPNGPAPSPFGDDAYVIRRTERDFEISYKTNPQLKVFEESISQYHYWASRVKDHVSRTNPRWKHILEYCAKYPNPIRREDLIRTHCDGVCAWELALKLDLWLADWFNMNLYNRRVQLAGGRDQAGNGFEVWRQLYLQYAGGSSAVRHGGQARLKDWPKCTNIMNLEAHLDGWKACLDEYGQEMFAAPGMLRTMLLEILPDEFENDVLDRPELVDHEQILAFVKRRLEHKRQKKLAEHARKHGGAMVNAVTTHEAAPAPEPVPPPPTPPADYSLMRELVNALKDRQPRHQRDQSPGRGRPVKTGAKFMWDPRDCWHCKGKHKREQCEDWLRVMKAHNGSKPRAEWKPPPGYESAKAKAYKKWRESNPRVNALGCETDDDSDSDEESSFLIASMGRKRPSQWPKLQEATAMPTCANRVSFKSKNKFDALEEDDVDDHDDSEAVIEQLGQWAHKTEVGKQSQKTKKKDRLLTSTKDLDQYLARNPSVATLPTDKKKLSKVMKLISKKTTLEENETLVLVDSGSTINVAKMKEHFPAYVNHVIPSSGSLRGETATTACGRTLKNHGKCIISGTSDSQRITVPFQDMDVELPIISVRKCVTSGKDVRFFENGSELRDRRTGKTIRIFKIDGTYFIKFKVDEPNTDGVDPVPFHRQGR